MSAKPNSIETLPTLSSELRVHVFGEPLARVVIVGAVGAPETAPSTQATFGPGWRSSEARTGEFWETLSYAVIWLCGLIGVGLCFL